MLFARPGQKLRRCGGFHAEHGLDFLVVAAGLILVLHGYGYKMQPAHAARIAWRDSRSAVVASRTPSRLSVHNFAVAGVHSYLVGAQVYSHNVSTVESVGTRIASQLRRSDLAIIDDVPEIRDRLGRGLANGWVYGSKALGPDEILQREFADPRRDFTKGGSLWLDEGVLHTESAPSIIARLVHEEIDGRSKECSCEPSLITTRNL